MEESLLVLSRTVDVRVSRVITNRQKVTTVTIRDNRPTSSCRDVINAYDVTNMAAAAGQNDSRCPALIIGLSNHF